MINCTTLAALANMRSIHQNLEMIGNKAAYMVAQIE
jgi:hypothetical protein